MKITFVVYWCGDVVAEMQGDTWADAIDLTNDAKHVRGKRIKSRRTLRVAIKHARSHLEAYPRKPSRRNVRRLKKTCAGEL